jgi:hypothetical protein
MRCRKIAGLVLLTGTFLGVPVHAESTKKSREKFTSLGDYNAAPKLSEEDLKKTKVDEAKKKKNASRRTFTAQEFGLDAADLVFTFKAISTLIKKEKEPGRRTVLLLNRAKIFYMLGQSSYLAQKSTVQVGPKARRYFDLGKLDAKAVLQIPTLSPLQRIEAIIVTGLVEIYLGREPTGVALFESAYKLDPGSRWAAWTGLYIGEYQFENSQFSDAKTWYLRIVQQGSGHEKKLALYKLAWTEINLRRPDEAEKIFMSLVRQDPNDSWGRDSARDLAVLISGKRSPKEILSITNSLFGKLEQGRDFLKLVNTLLYDRGQTADAMIMTEHLLATEKNPQEVIKLKLLRLRANARGFASKKHADLYVDLVLTMEKIGVMKNKKVFDFYKEDLHYETMALMAAYVDTFSNRIKTPEKFSRQEIGVILTKIYPIYEKYFPTSPKLPQVMEIWMDTCIEIQEDRCAIAVASRITGRPILKPIHQRVRFETIAAFERLLSKKQAKPEELLTALQDYESYHPQAKDIETLRNRQVDLNVIIDDKEKALRVMESIYKDFPSKVALSRLQALRFKYNRFDSIVQEKGIPAFENEEIVEFRRNAILKLAEQSKEANRFRRVSELVDLFAATKPAPQRVVSVKQEFLKFLVQLEEADFMLEWIAREGPSAFSQPDYRGHITDMENHILWKGDFSRLLKFDELNPKKDGKIIYRMTLSKLAIGDSNWMANLSRVTEEEREYFESVALFQYPKEIRRYLEGSKKLSDDEKALLLFTYRIAYDNQTPEDGSGLERKLGSLYPVEWKEKKVSKASSTSCFNEIDWPKTREAEATFTQKLQLSVAKHQQCKKVLEKDMGNAAIPIREKEDLAEEAEDLERSIEKLILKSPRPAGLTPEQNLEYDKGIAGLAKNYADQANEFSKLREKIKKERKTDKKTSLDIPDRPDKWEYPEMLSNQENSRIKVLKSLLSGTSTVMAGLLYLDLLLLEKQIKSEDYENIRLGTILERFGKNEGVRRVILDYLDARGLKKLKEKWEDAA